MKVMGLVWLVLAAWLAALFLVACGPAEYVELTEPQCYDALRSIRSEARDNLTPSRGATVATNMPQTTPACLRALERLDRDMKAMGHRDGAFLPAYD